mmetsp:Transcript_10711/g.30529  ORF Transcript_10711/g.30529 Transcript_10711/m.30529 type:complete len:240 (-) Transcript_10711:387-1106(-)
MVDRMIHCGRGMLPIDGLMVSWPHACTKPFELKPAKASVLCQSSDQADTYSMEPFDSWTSKHWYISTPTKSAEPWYSYCEKSPVRYRLSPGACFAFRRRRACPRRVPLSMSGVQRTYTRPPPSNGESAHVASRACCLRSSACIDEHTAPLDSGSKMKVPTNTRAAKNKRMKKTESVLTNRSKAFLAFTSFVTSTTWVTALYLLGGNSMGNFSDLVFDAFGPLVSESCIPTFSTGIDRLA